MEEKGWLHCDGRKLERARYPQLYEKIEGAFGTPDQNTFNLPDLRGRFVRGVDNGAGRDPDAASRTGSAAGGNIGDQVGSAQEDALKKHRHRITLPPFSWKEQDIKQDSIITGKSVSSNAVKKVTDPEGKEETRPKNIYVNWIVRAK